MSKSKNRIRRPSLLATVALTLTLSAATGFGADWTAEQLEFFEAKVRPVLVKHCYECHSGAAKPIQGNLRLDSRAATLRGGDLGPAVKPGELDGSLLIAAVRYADDGLQMPPRGKLPAPVIADLEQWVRLGAPDPREETERPDDGPPRADPATHWAFQKIVSPPPPDDASRPEWPRTALDRLILARQRQAGLDPSPDAAPEQLLRRLYVDLLGLPPTYEQQRQFLEGPSELAYLQTVDRLLAQPQFGERWGRLWLDVARYADTKGYVFQEDRNYPAAFQYRDWVVRAWNADMPFDRFLKLQLAADQLAPEDSPQLAAMGFLTLGRRFLNNSHDIIDDRIDVVTRGTMAFTVTCARCHDHKYDPIPTQDYYSLYSVFANSNEPGPVDADKDPAAAAAPAALRLVDRPQTHEERVFLRGNPGARGDVAPRRFLRALSGGEAAPFERGSGRLELAERIASPDNPLTARVIVNRVWGRLLGAHFVDTPSDFGVRSQPPQQQAALDYLAADFLRHDWSLKHLIRQIVTSRTYRQASDDRAAALPIDPENRLFWRGTRRRLDFEAMRDGLLAAAGDLNAAVIGGPSVELTDAATRRRSLYAFVDRQNLPGLFRTFDFASPDTHSPERPRTTVPQQALFLMNNPFVQQQAEALARKADAGDESRRIQTLVRLAWSRDPSADEVERMRQFLQLAAANPGGLAPAWQFGYGNYDAATARVTDYRRLPHWTGSSWQGGDQLPDSELNWTSLRADGGHPGERFAAIRRWVAPRDTAIQIRGPLKHTSDQGDGVRARIVSSRQGLLAEAAARHSESPLLVDTCQVQAGETIDFVVDRLESTSFDSFQWVVDIESADGGSPASWNSQRQFRGPTPSRFGPWERLAQVLLLSNEFMFLD